MRRKITEYLIKWKSDKNRMPLILYGARQVGKTFAVNEFGREHFDNVIYVNFETTPRLAADFDSDISPRFLINRMELYFERKIDPENSLIFFDEIQACERALTSLKYFCEEAPEYHVVAAGSLLGVAVNREKYSFPVGRVNMKTLYPMDFEEFLGALGKNMLLDEIRKCYEANTPLDGALHEAAMDIYRAYLVVGGMPQAVSAYRADMRMIDAAETQRMIIDSYIADMAKYISPSETSRVMACYNSIPAQLAKENRKFQYKVIQRGGKASLFGASLDWLSAAGAITLCDRIEHGYMPPEAYKDLSSFKVYMNDTGLLVQKSGLIPHDVLTGNTRMAGAIAENYVANALRSSGHKLYYWTSSSQAEVDFVIQTNGSVIPIEVKSDDHVKSRSLSVYCQRYKPDHAIRISSRNFGFHDGIKSVPLYATFCI